MPLGAALVLDYLAWQIIATVAYSYLGVMMEIDVLDIGVGNLECKISFCRFTDTLITK